MIRAALALGLLAPPALAGCGLPPASAAETTSPPGAAVPAPDAPRPQELDHAFAPSPAALHAIFADRLVAGPDAPRAGLQAHADALELDGSSWALVGGQPRYVADTPGGPRPWPVGRLPHDGRPPPATEEPAAELRAAWEALGPPGAPWHARDRAGHTFLWRLDVPASCFACHEWAASASPGAYLYRFEELADD